MLNGTSEVSLRFANLGTMLGADDWQLVLPHWASASTMRSLEQTQMASSNAYHITIHDAVCISRLLKHTQAS